MTNASDHLLIDAAKLSEHIADPDWATIDCRFALTDPDWGRARYDEGHIPSARYAHLDDDLSSPIGPGTGRHPLPDPALLCRKLGAWGIDASTRVVVYDDVGGGFAVRLWWLLRWLGHDKAAVLDGGLPAWIATGGQLTTTVPQTDQRPFTGEPNDDIWLTTADVEANLNTHRFQLVDARAAERFRGDIEPIDPVAGHIPGAMNLPLTGNLGDDGRFLPPSTLRQRFTATLGDRQPDTVVHSCGSGVNACHNLFAMELAELPGSRIYAGSWSEWIRSPERPVVTGSR